MSFERSTPILRVRDLAASIGYYVNVLGFQNAHWATKLREDLPLDEANF